MYSERDIVSRSRHTNLAIVRMVQLQTAFGNDMVDIGSVQTNSKGPRTDPCGSQNCTRQIGDS